MALCEVLGDLAQKRKEVHTDDAPDVRGPEWSKVLGSPQGRVGVRSQTPSAFAESCAGPRSGLVLGTMTRRGHPSQPCLESGGKVRPWSQGIGHLEWPKGWELRRGFSVSHGMSCSETD